jgi:transcriptional regulator with XRE-family HTH domain
MSEAQSPDAATISAIVASNLHRLRTQAELSIGEVARRAGVSKSTVSALESGTANPSIETLWAIAMALGLPFGQLVLEPTATVRVIRAGDGARVTSPGDARYAVRLLASSAQRCARDIYVVEAEPGRKRSAEPHLVGTVEHILCSAGRIRTGPAGVEVELAAGDYAAFPGDVSHSYEALEPGTRATMVIEYT